MKYSLTENKRTFFSDRVLYQIKAERDIEGIRVKKGELGGWIEKEDNLSQRGDCWVSGDAYVYQSALVCENACIFGAASIFGHARISGHARVYNNACVFEYAQVYGYTQVFGNVCVYGHAHIYGSIQVYGDVCIFKTIQADKELTKVIDSRDEIDLLLDCVFN